MNESKRVNPLHRGALTTDEITTGERIVCWKPGDHASTRHLVVLNTPYTDEGGTLVVDVRHEDGRETSEPTSELGLTGNRYTGEWTVIAIRDEETS